MKFLFNVIIYSIFGFIFENLLFIILEKEYDSGFTFGPYTLVYGISLAIIFVLFKYIFKFVKNKFISYIVCFFTALIAISLLEYCGGLLIEKTFGEIYWDYSEYPLTFNKYINLFISTFWAIASILIYKFILPITNKIFIHIREWMIITMTSLILVDVFFSVLSKL